MHLFTTFIPAHYIIPYKAKNVSHPSRHFIIAQKHNTAAERVVKRKE